MNLCEIVPDDDPRHEVEIMAKAKVEQPETVEPEVKEVQPTIDLAAMREEIKADLLVEFQAKTDE